MIVTQATQPTSYNQFLENQIDTELQSLIWDYVQLLIGVEEGNKKKVDEAKDLIFSLLYLLGQQIGSDPNLSKQQRDLLASLIKQLGMVASLSDSFLLRPNNLLLIEELVASTEKEIAEDDQLLKKIFNLNS